ncbi:MAG: sugar ABC transporter permease [Spirochaetaceae bacterium]|nr:MAG: sugar ABC transporter permease [Spirochaetaceae bacterium]
MTLHKHWKGITLFLLPAVILYAAFFIYPLGFVFSIGLTSWNGVTAPQFRGVQNFVDLLMNGTFRLSVRNNFIWALSLGFLQIFLAALVAMILTRRPSGWRVLRTIYFLPNVISQVAIAMLWMAIYNADHGILNQILTSVGLEHLTHNWLGEIETALPAVIAQQVLYIGYFMIIVLAGTMAIPVSFYEAAEIDGANVWQQEIHITLPMVRGILITAMTLAMAYGMRHFEATFLMTAGGPANSTSVMGLMLYNMMGHLDYGHANAVGAFLIILGGVLIVTIRSLLGRTDTAAEARQ